MKTNKTKLLAAILFLLTPSCMTGYTDSTKGIAGFNIIGGNADKIVSTPAGIMVDGLETSTSFGLLAKAAVSITGINALADVTKHADKMDAQTSSSAIAGGVSNTKTAAGVAVNASNNAAAVESLKVKGATAIGILKNTPTP